MVARQDPGSRLRQRRQVTSYDVALAAGVAQSTVSRCFDDSSSIAPETRERVRAIAAKLGYVRNALARSLITRRSNIVGVIATRLINRSNPDVVFAIAEALAASGRKLLLFMVENTDAIAGVIDEALGYPLDGLIACAPLTEQDATRFVDRKVPVVFFNHHIRAPGVDSVCTDHASAARDVAERLHSAGHRRYLCISGPPKSPVSVARTRAFLARLAELGVSDVPLLASDYSYEGGHATFLAAIEDGAARPQVVFCANDQLAFGVMDAARYALGLAIPDQLSVVGFDDVPDAARPVYGLTTVRQDLAEMGRVAVSRMERRLQDPLAAGEITLLPGSLILRRSARMS